MADVAPSATTGTRKAQLRTADAVDFDGLPDNDLVQRFAAGDERAFAAFVRRHQDRVFRLAVVWLDDRHAADDAAQEVFLRAFDGLRGFRFRAAPFTWLYRTTRFVCNEFNRRRRALPLDDEPVDGGESVADGLDRTAAARRVRALVSELPERQREVVVLRIFEELSVAETARAMRCREGTVKALLHKAIARLRLDYDKEEQRA